MGASQEQCPLSRFLTYNILIEAFQTYPNCSFFVMFQEQATSFEDQIPTGAFHKQVAKERRIARKRIVRQFVVQ